MKKQYSKHCAFSLLELAIVMAIMGLLLAGTLEGSSLIRQSKLKSAKMITQSSPINKIKNLAMWYDATAKNAFDVSRDKSSIGTWYDINPNPSIKNNATQTINDYKPIYIKDGINRLPSVKFDGTNDLLNFSTSSLAKGNYTIFAIVDVNNLRGPSETHNFISTSNINNGIEFFFFENTNNTTFTALRNYYGIGGASNSVYHPWNSSPSADKPFVIIARYDKTSDISLTSKDLSGIKALTEQNKTDLETFAFSSDHQIGKTCGCDIGEIIIFNRNLKNDEIESIKKYLIRKWSIKS